jgi:hypothetical protein
LCSAKEATVVKATLIFHYSSFTKDDGTIIFNNIYTNLASDGLSTILADLAKAGKYVTKIVMTSPSKLTSIELQPLFVSEPVWIKPIKELADTHNQIMMDLTNLDRYDPDLINQLMFYKLVIPDNVDRLGIIVYGYSK